jgi:hypothetical protein
VSLSLWPASRFDNAIWTVTARTNEAGGAATAATLAPGSGLLVKLPADPVRLSVQFTGNRGEAVLRMIDLPTNLSVDDVYPTLWMTATPQGPMPATGPCGCFPLIPVP